MNTEFLKTRQTKYTLYVVAYIAVIVVALGFANFLASRHNKSIDATSNKRFSLSDQTAKVVKGLTQDVSITYFDRSTAFATSRDLLDRYGNLSTKLKIAYVDPDKKPQLAKAAGIRNYGSIVIQTVNKKEEAKSLTEEEITGALIRALKGGERMICFVSGSGEHGLEDSNPRTGYSSAKESLERNNFKTKAISLLEKPEVPNTCTALLIAGPKFDYTEPAINAIKTYVEKNGGRALIMVDPPYKFAREENLGNPPLAKMLEEWGVTLNRDLALDTSGIGQIFGLSEVVPLVTTYENHAIVREMKEVATAFPLSRTIETRSVDKATVEKLFSTSGNSFATTKTDSTEIRLDPKKDKKGPLTLAVAGTYKGEKEGRFVVVGSSGWVANNIFRFNGNRDMFLNMISWLTSDEDLISIRPKDPEDRRLSLSRRQMSSIFTGSVIGFPVIIIASGLVVWWKRR